MNPTSDLKRSQDVFAEVATGKQRCQVRIGLGESIIDLGTKQIAGAQPHLGKIPIGAEREQGLGSVGQTGTATVS